MLPGMQGAPHRPTPGSPKHRACQNNDCDPLPILWSQTRSELQSLLLPFFSDWGDIWRLMQGSPHIPLEPAIAFSKEQSINSSKVAWFWGSHCCISPPHSLAKQKLELSCWSVVIFQFENHYHMQIFKLSRKVVSFNTKSNAAPTSRSPDLGDVSPYMDFSPAVSLRHMPWML